MVCYGYDQKYTRKGAPRSKHRAAERVDASGSLVELVSMVYVNTIRFQMPLMVGGGITPREVLRIQRSPMGGYTRSPLRVKLVLDPDTVKASLDDMVRESMDKVKQVLRRSKVPLSEIGVGLVARSQWGKPNVDMGMPTPFDLLPPNIGCDTKSYLDGISENEFIEDDVLRRSGERSVGLEPPRCPLTCTALSILPLEPGPRDAHRPGKRSAVSRRSARGNGGAGGTGTVWL